MSKVPPGGVSLTEETVDCDTSEAVEAVVAVVALVEANELMFTLESFEVPTLESKVFATVPDDKEETDCD